jgi:hypothetical protein
MEFGFCEGASRRAPAWRISPRSRRAVRAIPENRPPCALARGCPCGLKVGTGFVESRGGAVEVLAWTASGVKAAKPFPRVRVVWVASAHSDHADVNIAVIDVPAVVAFAVSAASEDGHDAYSSAAGAGRLIAQDVGAYCASPTWSGFGNAQQEQSLVQVRAGTCWPPTEAALFRFVGLHGSFNFVGEQSEVLM